MQVTHRRAGAQSQTAQERGVQCAGHRHRAHLHGAVTDRAARRAHPRDADVSTDAQRRYIRHHHRGTAQRQAKDIERRSEQIRRAITVRVYINRLMYPTETGRSR